MRGFGVFYLEEGIGGVFLGRHDARPLLTPADHLPTPPWWPDDLPVLRHPRRRDTRRWRYLAGSLLRWILLYERWIRSVEPQHREAVVADWGTRGRLTVPARRMVHGWRAFEVRTVLSSEHHLPGELDDEASLGGAAFQAGAVE